MSEHEEQAMGFLKKANATMEIKCVGTVDRFPNDDSGFTGERGKYEYTIKRNGKTYTFDFYGSINDWAEGRNPTAYDFLACCTKDEVPVDVWDFADEFGYDIHDKKSFQRVSNIHKACQNEYQAISELFGDVLEDLREIY